MKMNYLNLFSLVLKPQNQLDNFKFIIDILSEYSSQKDLSDMIFTYTTKNQDYATQFIQHLNKKINLVKLNETSTSQINTSFCFIFCKKSFFFKTQIKKEITLIQKKMPRITKIVLVSSKKIFKKIPSLTTIIVNGKTIIPQNPR